jgi:hypothetical protein
MQEGKAQLTWCWKWLSGFFQSFLVVYPCLKILVLVRFPSVDVFLLSAACSSLLFSFFLWFWKLVLEKRQSVVMLVLSSFFKLLPLVLFAFFFSGFSSAHCVCVLKMKAKLGYVGFLFFSPVSVSVSFPWLFFVYSLLWFFSSFFSGLSLVFSCLGLASPLSTGYSPPSVVFLPLYFLCCSFFISHLTPLHLLACINGTSWAKTLPTLCRFC